MAQSFNQSESLSQGTSRSGSSSRTRIVPGMLKIYNQLLAKNTANYNNLMAEHAQAAGNLQTSLSSAYGSYDTTLANVMNMIQGQGQTAYGLNRKAAEKAQGTTQQQMINAGLGNTTLLGNATNQNMQNFNFANNDLAEKLAHESAGRLQDIGLARSGAMVTGAGTQAHLDESYMGNLAGYRFQNEAGNMLGSFSNSSSSSQQTAASNSLGNSYGGEGGGGGGGYGRNDGGLQPRNLGPNPTIGMGWQDPSQYGMGGGMATSYPMGGNQPQYVPYQQDYGNVAAAPTPESQNYSQWD